MALTSRQLNITQNNASVPFFPSSTWDLLNADILTNISGITDDLPTFSWIEGFFNASSLTVAPTLALWNGEFFPGTQIPVLSGIQFGYSGQRINIKGRYLFLTGQNIRNQTVSSIPIDASSPTTSFNRVIASGGMY